MLANEEPVLYTLANLKNKKVPGHFYRSELVKGKKPTENDIYSVEKVLKRRTKNGIKESYVKYLGYNKTFNEWIPDSNFK